MVTDASCRSMQSIKGLVHLNTVYSNLPVVVFGNANSLDFICPGFAIYLKRLLSS